MSETLRQRPGSQRTRAKIQWRQGLEFSVALGALLGVAWWLLAPGGAFYGDGEDVAVWFPRDAVLATLLVVGGVLSAGRLLRQRRESAHGPLAVAAYAAALVGGLAGSVVAWRMGVFAGDLFHTPANNLPHPSMVFSLRSATVLLLWPLATVSVVLVTQLFSYSIHPPAAPPDQLVSWPPDPGVAAPSEPSAPVPPSAPAAPQPLGQRVN